MSLIEYEESMRRSRLIMKKSTEIQNFVLKQPAWNLEELKINRIGGNEIILFIIILVVDFSFADVYIN